MQSRFPAGILTDFKGKRRSMAEKMQANCVRIISGSVLSIAYPYPAVKQVCRFRYLCTKIKNILLSALFFVDSGADVITIDNAETRLATLTEQLG